MTSWVVMSLIFIIIQVLSLFFLCAVLRNRYIRSVRLTTMVADCQEHVEGLSQLIAAHTPQNGVNSAKIKV